VAEGFPGGYAADDGAAPVFADGVLEEVVTSRPGARAYRVALVDVALVDGEVREEPLAFRLLAPGDHDMARSDP
jgi:dipeptidase E